MNVAIEEKQILGVEYFDNSESNSISSLIEATDFNACEGQLVAPLGIDSAGKKYYEDLAAIPHILVSGTTGSGKTAFIQSIMASLMMTHGKEDVQFVICDTKGIDYMCFRNSKYLYLPIIKNDTGYSNILELINRRVQNGDYSRDYHRTGTKDNPAHIFVIIDDFASTYDSDRNIEMLKNILKDGRNTGVHCILVTSIPSAEIISTELKSNIPCRISFRTATKQVSRIVIDENGAEMLMIPGEMIAKVSSKTIKCKCIYSPYEEIETFIKNESSRKIKPLVAKNDQSISKLDDIYAKVLDIFSNKEENNKEETRYAGLKSIDNYMESTSLDSSNDPMYEEVVQYVKETQKASSSLLQRRFGIGYNRAVRLIDTLENKGIVGPANGSKPREVYVSSSNNNTYRSKIDNKNLEFITNSELSSDKDDEKPLRPFPFTSVSGGTFSVYSNEIHLSKKMKFKGLPGTATPTFGGQNIIRIRRRAPRFGRAGYFAFDFNSKTNISVSGEGANYIDVDNKNISNICSIEFNHKEEHIVNLFLNQLAEDLDLPITIA